MAPSTPQRARGRREWGWPARAPLGGLAPRRRVFVLGLVAVLVALVAVVGTSVAREYEVPPVAAPDDLGTILLVPGYGGDAASLQPLALRLRVAGRDAAVVGLPDGGTGDLQAQAAAIDTQVREVLRHGARSVDLIGYSAGGVASWLYLQTGRTAPAVRRLVTLGSPLQGAELAAAGGALVPGACPRACQQLAPGSSLLTSLDTGPRPAIPWLSLWTTDDETVTPPSSAALPGITSVSLQSVCENLLVSHSRMPNSGLTVGLLLRALGTGPLPRPTPGDCNRIQAEATGRPLRGG